MLVLECVDITCDDGKGFLVTMNRDERGHLFLHLTAPSIDVSLIGMVAQIASKEL